MSDSYRLTASTARANKCAMSYNRYAEQIILKYHVKLEGWPVGVKFVSPSGLSTMDDVRTLRDSLRCGDCYWKALTSRQQQEYAAEYRRQRVTGEITVKARKERSDKGKKRPDSGGKRKRTEGVEDSSDEDTTHDGGEPAQSPCKKGKNAARLRKQLPSGFRSREFISDSEDDGV